MAVFTAFELRGGWIHGFGRIYFNKIPSKGEWVEIASVNTKEVRQYEVLDVELTTDSTSAGNIVLTPLPKPNGPHPSAEPGPD